MSLKQIKPSGSTAGFSLLEVLVAATVFSLGLAGLAALLLTNIVTSANARHAGTAAVAAANLAEQIHLNPLAINSYINPSKYVSRLCMGAAHCTPEQQADYDFKLWKLELADNIRNASGLVCRDSTPEDGSYGNDLCDGTGPLVIKVFWSGRASSSRRNTDQQSAQHRLSLEVG